MGIKINIIDLDDGLLELEVIASSNHFKGEARLYTSKDSLDEFIQTIQGFPSSFNDNRSFVLGNFDPEYGGGGAKFHFRVLKRTTRTVVEVKLRTDLHSSEFNISETANFVIPIEAAALDRFIQQL